MGAGAPLRRLRVHPALSRRVARLFSVRKKRLRGAEAQRYTLHTSPAEGNRSPVFKKAILVVLQTLLFLILFGAGTLALPFVPQVPVWQVQTSPGRAFVLDGLFLTLAVYVLILAVEAARKRLRGPGGLTTLSLVLALALGLAMKFGFKSL